MDKTEEVQRDKGSEQLESNTKKTEVKGGESQGES